MVGVYDGNHHHNNNNNDSRALSEHVDHNNTVHKSLPPIDTTGVGGSLLMVDTDHGDVLVDDERLSPKKVSKISALAASSPMTPATIAATESSMSLSPQQQQQIMMDASSTANDEDHDDEQDEDARERLDHTTELSSTLAAAGAQEPVVSFDSASHNTTPMSNSGSMLSTSSGSTIARARIPLPSPSRRYRLDPHYAARLAHPRRSCSSGSPSVNSSSSSSSTGPSSSASTTPTNSNNLMLPPSIQRASSGISHGNSNSVNNNSTHYSIFRPTSILTTTATTTPRSLGQASSSSWSLLDTPDRSSTFQRYAATQQRNSSSSSSNGGANHRGNNTSFFASSPTLTTATTTPVEELGQSDRFIPSRATSNLNFSLWEGNSNYSRFAAAASSSSAAAGRSRVANNGRNQLADDVATIINDTDVSIMTMGDIIIDNMGTEGSITAATLAGTPPRVGATGITGATTGATTATGTGTAVGTTPTVTTTGAGTTTTATTTTTASRGTQTGNGSSSTSSDASHHGAGAFAMSASSPLDMLLRSELLGENLHPSAQQAMFQSAGGGAASGPQHHHSFSSVSSGSSSSSSHYQRTAPLAREGGNHFSYASPRNAFVSTASVSRQTSTTLIGTSNAATRQAQQQQQYHMPHHHQQQQQPYTVVNQFSLMPVQHSAVTRFMAPQKQKRRIQKVPFKVLDAPALQDDFYLNLVDWSSQNVLAVGLGSCVYLWSACTSKVTKLCDLAPLEDSVTSVSWAQRGNHLAVGTNRGEVQLWDTVACKKVRTMSGHSLRIGSLSWSGPTLASGSRDRLIYLRDVRIQAQYTAQLCSHKQEVCGLKWSFDEPAMLASGGNDNRLFVWDIKATSSPLHRFAEHTAAVKAIAWSPHQHGLLASGGGTADRCIRFWNTLSGVGLNCVDTGSQVCNLAWSHNCNELVSTHGYSLNQIVVWRYPSMSKVVTLTGHTYRVLYLAMSPDGSTIVTGAGDETLRFWQVFPGPRSHDKNNTNGLLFPSLPGSVIR